MAPEGTSALLTANVDRRPPLQRGLRDLSEISRGGGGVETEGGSQFFETAEKEGVMKNGPLKGGGSCKYVSVIM